MIGLISYHMIGLVDGTTELLKFLLVLILFNLTAAALCLAIGVVFKDLSMANLLSSMVMLFSMLFAGLLLNKGKHRHFWLASDSNNRKFKTCFLSYRFYVSLFCMAQVPFFLPICLGSSLGQRTYIPTVSGGAIRSKHRCKRL